jgi:hypothetical protein
VTFPLQICLRHGMLGLVRLLVDITMRIPAEHLDELSHRFWQEHLGSDSSVIGKRLRING